MSGLYYKDEYVEIWHGDCREILPTLPKVDLVLTDPPYGIKVIQRTYHNKNSKPGQALAHKTFYDASHEWDNQPPDPATMTMIHKAAPSVILWGGNYFKVPPSSCWLVWDKVNGSNDFADCELAWTNLNKAVRKFKWKWNGMLQENMADKDRREHPTQKPLALMKWCLTLCPDAKVTIDPYLGSGTTLRAAKDLGRKAIGIEIDERYCEIAAKRCNEAQPSMYRLIEASERQGALIE